MCSAARLEENGLRGQDDRDADEGSDDFHRGPRAEGLGNGHTVLLVDKPEAGIVDVG